MIDLNIKRLSVMLGIALLVVVAGIYWSGDSPQPQRAEQQDQEDAFRTADFDGDNWEVSDEAALNLGDEESGNQDQSKDPYNRFNIPGRVNFPQDVSPTKVNLSVNIQVLKPDVARNLARQDNPRQFMLGGSPEEKFEKRAISRSITTDENGKFKIKNAPPGIYGASTADSYWVGRTRTQHVQAKGQVTPLEMDVSRTAKLVGTVVDPDSSPVGSARIAYTTLTRKLKTDENGRFTIDSLEPGDPIDNIKILKDGFKAYYLDEEPLDPGEVRHDTFMLRKGAQLRVKVRDAQGNSVKEGRIILNRADDREISSRHHLAAAHGGAKMASIQSDGQYTFGNLRPGKVRITFRYSDYIPEVKTVTVRSGELTETTLTVPHGKPLNIRLVNEKNGEAVTSVRPKLIVFDENGNRIKPGYNIETIRSDGTIQAFLHPETARFQVHARSRLGRFETKKVEFTERDLPDVRISLVPSDTPNNVEPPTPPGLLSLESKGSVDWSTVSKGRIYVLDRSTGSRIHVQAGSGNVLSEPLPLEKGEYVIYGLFQRADGQSLSFLTEASVETKHPGTQTVDLQETASIDGSLTGLEEERYRDLQIGVSLLPVESVREPSDQSSVYYPDPLSASPEGNGEFSLRNIPAGSDLALHVVARKGASLDVPDGALLAVKPLSGLSPGENQSLPSLDLGKE